MNSDSENLFPPPHAAGQVYYKVVARVGPKMMSIFDGCTEYKVGSTLVHETPTKLNPNVIAPPGYYLYGSAEEAQHADQPKTSALFISPRIMIKCIAWGQFPTPTYPSFRGSIIMKYVRPIEVVPLPLGAKNTQPRVSQVLNIKLQNVYDLAPPFLVKPDEARRGHPCTQQGELEIKSAIANLEKAYDAEHRKEVLHTASKGANISYYNNPNNK